MSIPNVNPKHKEFQRRLLEIAQKKRELTEDEVEIGMEMKSNGVSSIEARGIKLSVKHAMEEPEKRDIRLSIEAIADSLRDTLREMRQQSVEEHVDPYS